jgi:class 3 adenylate cyclase
MTERELHYRWEWTVRSSPRALWPYIADTNRFNRDTGIPAIERVTAAGPLASARRRLRLYRLGLPVEWQEEPFEWVWPRRFGVVRHYTQGPLTEMRVLVDLDPGERGGTRVGYQVWVRPRHLLGRLAVPVEIGLRCKHAFAAAVRRFDELAAAPPARAVDGGVRRAAPELTAGARQRLAAGRVRLQQSGADPALAVRLVETLAEADDLALTRLRPYALADQWGASRRALLELCLTATRAGLLDLRWNLLCPLCRGAQASTATLSELRRDVHCETCQINFTVDFERLVELTFRPNPAIRVIEDREFCIGGPQVTPHVVVQQLLPPGGRRPVEVTLETGRYRVRALAKPGGQLVQATPDDGAAEVMLRIGPDGWSPGEAAVATTATLILENGTDEEQLLLLERVAWTDQAATAAEAIVLQTFRDLFASEALRPGERIAVGQVALVFTDLLGSTRLYQEVGDAPAFGHVMSHFEVLREAIVREGGGIVKTMGDAVMAAFGRPVAALRAVIDAQRRLGVPPDQARPFVLRVGIHAGPCIAVTLNERLDYFGSAVNVAARLEGLSTGRDVIVSGAVARDPEVAAWLAEAGAAVSVERFETALRGFDARRFEVCRITPGPGALPGLPEPPPNAEGR